MPQEIGTDFIQEVKELLNSARERTKAAINIAMVYTYYEIGRRILKQEQKGLNRAEYGKKILKQLSRQYVVTLTVRKSREFVYAYVAQTCKHLAHYEGGSPHGEFNLRRDGCP